MKTKEEACRQYAATAFEIAIKNCIQPAKQGQRRQVKISDADSKTLYSFYRERVNDDDQAAMLAIGLASRRAAGKSALIPVLFFMVALMFVLLIAFQSIWPLLTAVFGCALVIYVYWKRRRTAQRVWASRRAFKGGTNEALEKMCLYLALPVYRAVSMPVVGGLCAAILVTVFQTIKLFV